jgi:hypothetical protein
VTRKIVRQGRPLRRRPDREVSAALVYIASEDRYAVDQYFRAFQSTRVRVVVFPTEDGKSAASHVLARLKENMSAGDFNVEDGDTAWIVCDVDRQPEKHLSPVCTEAKQANVRLAFSNPCFEYWLLLHHTDVTDEAIAKRASSRGAVAPKRRPLTAEDCAAWLREVLGSYDKTALVPEHFHPHLATAITRAGAPEGRWPKRHGTHVGLLAAHIRELVPRSALAGEDEVLGEGAT